VRTPLSVARPSSIPKYNPSPINPTPTINSMFRCYRTSMRRLGTAVSNAFRFPTRPPREDRPCRVEAGNLEIDHPPVRPAARSVRDLGTVVHRATARPR
jgi:hypothetical protein